MIAFDNGPANGDYVRYIDDLMKRAAIAASAGVLTSTEGSGATVGRARDQLAPRAAAQIASQASRMGSSAETTQWTPMPGAGGRQAMADNAQGTGFAAATVATPGATAAAAIASALMSGQMGNRAALATNTKIGLGAITLGVVLGLVGFFLQPLNVLLIAGGAGLVAWAVRMMRDTSSRASSTRL